MRIVNPSGAFIEKNPLSRSCTMHLSMFCDYLQEMSPHKVSYYVERKILTRLLKLQANSNERKTVTCMK